MQRALLPATLLTFAVPLAAQEARQQGRTVIIPEYTEAQRLNRSAFLATSNLAMLISYAKAHGQSVDDVARWLGDKYAPGWGPANSGVAIRVARGMVFNSSAFPNAQPTIVSATDTSAVMRHRRGYVTYFGTTGQIDGTTVADLDRLFSIASERIASHLGLRYSEQSDSAWVTVTLGGRGSAAIDAFPRGAFSVTLAPEHGPGSVGTFESRYAPDGTFEVSQGGKVDVRGRYEIWLDQITISGEPGQSACPGSGTYRFVPQANGDLVFGRLSDSCERRARYLARRHVKR